MPLLRSAPLPLLSFRSSRPCSPRWLRQTLQRMPFSRSASPPCLPGQPCVRALVGALQSCFSLAFSLALFLSLSCFLSRSLFFSLSLSLSLSQSFYQCLYFCFSLGLTVCRFAQLREYPRGPELNVAEAHELFEQVFALCISPSTTVCRRVLPPYQAESSWISATEINRLSISCDGFRRRKRPHSARCLFFASSSRAPR
jgi:hypothetical protein